MADTIKPIGNASTGSLQKIQLKYCDTPKDAWSVPLAITKKRIEDANDESIEKIKITFEDGSQKVFVLES